MTQEEIETIVGFCEYRDWRLQVHYEGHGYMYLQVHGHDLEGSGLKSRLVEWTGRKWRLSRHMTRSEIVQTCWMAIKAAVEHETREHFKYRGAQVFGPHMDVEDIVHCLARGRIELDERPDGMAGQ